MKRFVFVLGVLLLAGWCLAAFPVVDQSGVQPNDNRLNDAKTRGYTPSAHAGRPELNGHSGHTCLGNPNEP